MWIRRRRRWVSKGSERLRGAFPQGQAALMPYLTAGYPTLDGAREVGEAYGRGRGGHHRDRGSVQAIR